MKPGVGLALVFFTRAPAARSWQSQQLSTRQVASGTPALWMQELISLKVIRQ